MTNPTQRLTQWWKQVHQWIIARTNEHGPQYGAYGLFGCLNAPLYYLIWCHIAPEQYECWAGRVISFILCLLLLLHRQWPKCLRPFLPHYWYATLWFTLPTFFAYMLVMNGGSSLWLANHIVMLFFLLCLVDTQSALIMLLTGSCLGGGAALLQLESVQRHVLLTTANYPGICLTYAAAIMIALCFLHNRERFTSLKCRQLKDETESQEKAAIIENLSHDLRTPLSGLLGLSDPANGFSSDSLHEWLPLIHQSAKQLHQLFESLLDHLKLTQPVTEQELPQCFALATWVETLAHLCQPAIVTKRLQWHVDHDDVMVKSYPLTLQRIVMALLHNAIQYTDQGTVSLRAHVRAHQLIIDVHDTGRGFNASDQHKLFRALSRLTPSYKQANSPGLGLGLCTAKQWTERLNGQLSATSPGMGQGSTFTLRVPVDTTPRIPRILLVEDTPISAHAACLMLQRAVSCEITHVETAADALTAAYQNTYDLILMDLGLPDGDGQTVAQTLHTAPQSNNQQTPIVAVTAHATEATLAECHTATITDVIAKPLGFEQAQQLVDRYLIVSQSVELFPQTPLRHVGDVPRDAGLIQG